MSRFPRPDGLLAPLLAAAALVASTAAGPAAAQVYGDPSAWQVDEPPQQTVLVRNATIWTQSSQGRVTGDLLVRGGKVVAVGAALDAPAGAEVIDASGKHVTPGLIDAHSHTAIEGSVNEATDIVTSQVRIADVIDADDVNIYRQLAGGVTAANLLHGSANAIGGQNAVIKLRWGATADGLLFAEAPQGIKFALGENPKQSNWNVENRRFPQTRSGVEEVIRQAFQAALNYRQEWDEHRRRAPRERNLVPPRRDLRLEALLEILDGTRLVHAHSYRADEILMLLRLAEDLGFRIASFQHVLEGYKVADELAAHGAGASTFSDWWAYKFEVIDAIPYNGAIMHDRGVVVSFNSDSNELARRLHLEAAKAVRYGGVAEEDALSFVTLNPAKQLGIDEWVGSLEPGKHADFVIWSGHPLDNLSIAEQTWVDGRKYFDRARSQARAQAVAAERDALLAKIEAKSEEEKQADEAADEASEGADPVGQDPPDPERAGAPAAAREVAR